MKRLGRRSGGQRLIETVEVRNNLVLTVRERGKIAARREGHNIWLNLGREYLANLISASSFGPLVRERSDVIQYMGLGIGGTQQLALPTANSPPLSTGYPGSNLQTDTDPTVTNLERPVRISSTSPGVNPYPGVAGDVWLGQVQAPPVFATATQVTFSILFGQTDISYNPFLTVPLSEIMLFTSSADPTVCPNATYSTYTGADVAYDTFDSISKTDAFDLEVAWTVRF